MSNNTLPEISPFACLHQQQLVFEQCPCYQDISIRANRFSPSAFHFTSTLRTEQQARIASARTAVNDATFVQQCQTLTTVWPTMIYQSVFKNSVGAWRGFHANRQRRDGSSLEPAISCEVVSHCVADSFSAGCSLPIVNSRMSPDVVLSVLIQCHIFGSNASNLFQVGL